MYKFIGKNKQYYIKSDENTKKNYLKRFNVF